MKHLCPICRKSTDSNTDADFPFCSERCRLIDLGNWAAERYVVSEPVFEEDELEDGKFDLRLTDDTLNDDASNPDPESDGESKSDATVDSDTRFDSNSGFDLGRDTSAHRPSGRHDSDG